MAEQNQPNEQKWREWMTIAVGLTGLLSAVAIIVSLVALSTSSSGAVAQAAPVSARNGPLSAASAPVAKPKSIRLLVKADDEKARRGPDGKWHDAFLPADFSVQPGDRVTVTVVNYDGGPHTFTSPSMGVNAIIPGGGSLSAPREMTFTFTAPQKSGRYQWWCAVPCDPWAMSHDGYMRGVVTVRA
jgi:plastocyanin